MARKPTVVLADLWRSAEARDQLQRGLVRLKLPIRPADYPDTHQMRELELGLPVSGHSGPLKLWLFDRYLVYLLLAQTRGDGDKFWGVEHASFEQALQIFANLINHDKSSRRTPYQFETSDFQPGRVVEVIDSDDFTGKHEVASLIDPFYQEGRLRGLRGRILCQATRLNEHLWLVRHEDGSVAAYMNYELREIDPQLIQIEEKAAARGHQLGTWSKVEDRERGYQSSCIHCGITVETFGIMASADGEIEVPCPGRKKTA